MGVIPQTMGRSSWLGYDLFLSGHGVWPEAGLQEESRRRGRSLAAACGSQVGGCEPPAEAGVAERPQAKLDEQNEPYNR